MSFENKNKNKSNIGEELIYCIIPFEFDMLEKKKIQLEK